jgi:succinate-acetate transporter protein
MAATDTRLESRDGETALAQELASEAAASVADPAPLGLAAFALTTFCLSLINAGLVAESTEPIVFGLALFYGGAAQLLAGMWEFKKGNTFGATAFTSFGAFWLSFWAFEHFYASKVPEADLKMALGMFLLAWGIFTAYMLIASLRTSVALVLVFATLTATFFLLAYGDLAKVESMEKYGGWMGILTAILAWYASMAAVVESTFGKAILPNPSLK